MSCAEVFQSLNPKPYIGVALPTLLSRSELPDLLQSSHITADCSVGGILQLLLELQYLSQVTLS